MRQNYEGARKTATVQGPDGRRVESFAPETVRRDHKLSVKPGRRQELLGTYYKTSSSRKRVRGARDGESGRSVKLLRGPYKNYATKVLQDMFTEAEDRINTFRKSDRKGRAKRN